MDQFVSVLMNRTVDVLTNRTFDSLASFATSVEGRIARQSIHELDFSSEASNDFIEIISGDVYRIWAIYLDKAGDIIMDSCGSCTKKNQEGLTAYFRKYNNSTASYRISSTAAKTLDDQNSWTAEKLDGPWFGMSVGAMRTVLMLAITYSVDNMRLKRVCFRPSESRAWVDYWEGWDTWDRDSSAVRTAGCPTMCCVPASKDDKFIFHVKATKVGKLEQLAMAMKRVDCLL